MVFSLAENTVEAVHGGDELLLKYGETGQPPLSETNGLLDAPADSESDDRAEDTEHDTLEAECPPAVQQAEDEDSSQEVAKPSMNRRSDPEEACSEMRDEGTFGSNDGKPSDVRAAFELLVEALAAERTSALADVAHAAEIESFDYITVRARELWKLETQIRTFQTDYAELSGKPSHAGVRARACNTGPAPGHLPARQPAGVERRGTLTELARQNTHGSKVTGGKPKQLCFPDGTPEEVLHWNELAVAVVRWLTRNADVTVPFRRLKTNGRYFLNWEPKHADGAPFNPVGMRDIPLKSRKLWVDTHRSAADILRCLESLARACGQPPAGFEVVYRPKDR